MKAVAVPYWKESPFLRLLLPLAAGIVTQWYCQLPVRICWLVLAVGCCPILSFPFYRAAVRYRLSAWVGIALHSMLFALGGLLCYYKDARHKQGSVTAMDSRNAGLLVTLQEPLVKKPASWKGLAEVDAVLTKARAGIASGKILIYFASGSLRGGLGYGSRLLLCKTPEPIRNTGNPGSFDYRQYCAFQQIHHQVYLRPGDYKVLPGQGGNRFDRWLLQARQQVVEVLRRWIGPQEAGLAEALLIGYKDDLDKELVQSYANTGVVHIIAISGMHLGLIYWVLTKLFFFLRRLKLRWLEPFCVIACLWLFALLTGGSASVMRSAVMFTCVVGGQFLGRQGASLNSLGASAFLLLCYNPFWLWDAGFQLSYGAVLGIMLFMQPLYGLIPVSNPLLDALAKAVATTMAAQVLTLPVSLFLFQQFPVYFPVTNLVTIPLSSLIVLAEILLCTVSRVPGAGALLGTLISGMIRMMNGFVAGMEHMPGSSWQGLNVSLLQTLLLYAIIIAAGCWLWLRKPSWLLPALGLVLLFVAARGVSVWQARSQRKLIVYNIPRHQAVDLVAGQQAVLYHDSSLLSGPAIARNMLKPSRTIWRGAQLQHIASGLFAGQAFMAGNRRILLLEQPLQAAPGKKIALDVLVVSGNPKLRMDKMLEVFRPGMVVFDASNSQYHIQLWTAACTRAGVSTYSVTDKGAFVLNLD